MRNQDREAMAKQVDVLVLMSGAAYGDVGKPPPGIDDILSFALGMRVPTEAVGLFAFAMFVGWLHSDGTKYVARQVCAGLEQVSPELFQAADQFEAMLEPEDG